jgi:hypothetical protein
MDILNLSILCFQYLSVVNYLFNRKVRQVTQSFLLAILFVLTSCKITYTVWIASLAPAMTELRII